MTTAEATVNTVNSTEQEFFIIRTLRETKASYSEKAKLYNEKAIKLKDKGKEFFTEVEQEARKALNNIIENGKKCKEKAPFIGAIEKKVNDGLDTVRNQINLPSKNDIERLSIAMNALNERVTDLNQRYMA